MARGRLIRIVLGCLSVLALVANTHLDHDFGGEFTVRERLEGVGERRFILFTSQKTLATAIGRDEKDSKVFEIRDGKGEAYVVFRVRKRPWGSELLVSDQKGGRIGALKEKVQPGLLRDKAIWEVRDARGELLALTTPQDALSTELALVDAKDGNRVDLSRPQVSVSDYWKVKLSTKLTWDRRLVFALALYRVASDAERRR
jgi:hypothetical protein